MTEQQIVFMTQRAPDAAGAEGSLDALTQRLALAQLSPAAQRIAAGIVSTLPYAPGSLVLVGAHRTYEELLADGCPLLPPELLARGVEAARQALGASWLKRRPIVRWPWPLLEQGVAPEQYLNQQVQAMQNFGQIEYVFGEPSRWLTVEETAPYLHVTARQVRSLCQEGVLPHAQKRGPLWMVPLEDLLRSEVALRRRPGQAPPPEWEQQARRFLREVGLEADPRNHAAGPLGQREPALEAVALADLLSGAHGEEFKSYLRLLMQMEPPPPPGG